MGGVWTISKNLMTDMENGILFPTQSALKQRQRVYGSNVQGLKINVDHWMNRQILNKLGEKYDVMRAGKIVSIEAREIVVGDVLLLQTGVIVPCDGILITKSKKEEIEVDEGAMVILLTKGENEEEIENEIHNFIKLKNFSNPFIFSYSQILQGKGKMLVTVVGSNSTYQRHYIRSLPFLIIFKRMKQLKKMLVNISIEEGKKFTKFDIPIGRNGYYIIHWICKNCDIELLKLLLKHVKMNLNIQTKKEFLTPLNLSIKHSQDLISILLKRGADPNILDIFGRNSLFYAIRFGNWKFLKMVYDYRGKIDILDKYNWSLLHYSVIYNPKLLRNLLQLGKEEQIKQSRKENIFFTFINKKDRDGNTCFFYSLVTGKSDEILDLLHSFGSDINLRNSTGRNVLHYICMGDLHPYFLYFQKKRILVFNCGDDISIPNIYIKRQCEVKREKLTMDLNYNSLRRVLKKSVIEYKVHINERDKAGLFPIHYLFLASKIYHNPSLLRYLKKIRKIAKENLDDLKEILEAFDNIDKYNRNFFFRYALTLLVFNGATFTLRCPQSNDMLTDE